VIGYKKCYADAILMAEEQRESLSALEKSGTHFLGDITTKFLAGKNRTWAYEGMVNVSIDTPSEAFFYSENLKARVLTEAIARSHSIGKYIIPENLAKEENYYTTQIRGLKTQMDTLFKNEVMETFYEREKELKEVTSNQQQFISKLRINYPEYAAIHYPNPIKPNEVTLNSKEVLIEFEVTDSMTIVFALKNGGIETRAVPISRENLHKLVLQYRGFFEGITKTSQLLDYKPELGKRLYDFLFGDLLASVAEGTTLVIVPDECLGILPFEALVNNLPKEVKVGEGEYGPFPLGVSYLADKYLINYAQSATSLTLLRTLKKDVVKGEDLLVIADPIFSANDSRLRTIVKIEESEQYINLMGAIVNWRQMGVAGVRAKTAERDIVSEVDELFPRLEKTEALAKKLESLFGGKAQVLRGAEAKEDNLLRPSLSAYRYLTFATHGILDNTVPYIREPALVLTQVGNPEGVDGFLTMSEVMGLRLDADVVALTACGTGLGKNVSGEGVMGMGRAFQYAGARNVLVSLWSVAESSATELTGAFFTYVREGHEPKEAIQLARNEIRRKGYEHPFYWASFILLGK